VPKQTQPKNNEAKVKFKRNQIYYDPGNLKLKKTPLCSDSKKLFQDHKHYSDLY